MYILPAIDIIDARCVRLIQGDYSQKINYRDDPAAQAADFIAAGAEWLHVVDLDGAKAGRPVNTATIARLAALKQLKVEVGGGIRDETAITALLALGVERVIIGTKAVTDFAWFSQMANAYPGKIVLGLDARDAKVATEAWLKESSRTLLDFAVEAAKLPLAAIIYTDISRDGMLTGPNIENTKALVNAVKIDVIASGGISSLGDIKKLMEKVNPAGAITGRALYEGKINLTEAIKITKQ